MQRPLNSTQQFAEAALVENNRQEIAVFSIASIRILCKTVRTMRTNSPLLSSLFTMTTQGILSATVLRPDKEWYLSDLAAHLGVRPSSLQRPLLKLSRAGILQRQRNGNRVYYRADPACPILVELTSILTKTSGIAEPLRKALAPLDGQISIAFIHGSVAEAREHSESDIDLIIAGDVSNSDVAFALRPLQEQLGRAVNATRYALTEFTAKAVAGHHFLAAVLKRPRIFLIGSEHELEKIIGRQASGSGTDEQARA